MSNGRRRQLCAAERGRDKGPRLQARDSDAPLRLLLRRHGGVSASPHPALAHAPCARTGLGAAAARCVRCEVWHGGRAGLWPARAAHIPHVATGPGRPAWAITGAAACEWRDTRMADSQGGGGTVRAHRFVARCSDCPQHRDRNQNRSAPRHRAVRRRRRRVAIELRYRRRAAAAAARDVSGLCGSKTTMWRNGVGLKGGL